ncbi:MAG TPA: hypothetical protein VJ673_04465 [Aromatoleum sp.]|uniref:hypothetical protein n=1 Tax=Aromatoleum sp. TaxID=2307007 RepID=UPI002B499CC3|nr:hypothetical protein [Aromatoleum sp.]HJV24914.1 hypothetical protein [Aromatoleum sp.]
MDAELYKLENQIEQLIGLYETCKADGRELRARLARLEAENRVLADKVRLATSRLESVLEQLPES